ncbi:MAG: transporter [Solirubrobacterales bacterium]|nr:transporter [Solirubrobacterales bacterium]
MAVKSLWVEPERPAAEIEWPAVAFHDVFRIFRTGTVETVALRGLELRIDRGEFVGVLGPSGSGKSTFLSLAAALDEPSAGEVLVLGHSLSRLEENERARLRAEELALIFQATNLLPALSALENVTLALELAGKSTPRDRAVEALTAFGLGERLGNRAGALSGGEQQRVAIAAAAAREAPLVLADEPTGELDARNEAIVLEALATLRRDHGATVVVVTHSERVAAAAERVIEIRDGKATQ